MSNGQIFPGSGKSMQSINIGLWLRTGCVTNAQVSFFERTGF